MFCLAQFRLKVRKSGNVQGKVKLHGDYVRVDVFGFEHQDAVRPLLDNLQAKLLKNGLDPRIPWLNNHKICFRFM
ncbi:hypothetical protein HKBW3S33_01587 [Candidatus Hakubella thermalkaliphila]|uniref:Uncharacterized protein n=1 Tax=Candidatus Hakubella thermalkaliphila TaxID=2754717 RepID=A0A6V8P805_9ACTN|nr:hypothetical protein HKBW3S33_01587 [Candidatus Hakubella thermalkaliphila]